MPEPILTTSLIAAGYATTLALSRQGSAVSAEAAAVRSNAAEVIQGAKRSVALFGRSDDLVFALFELSQECREANWDGYGAEPVEPEALRKAVDLIVSLPDHLPLPECSVEPDGAVSLDWMPAPHRTLTVSVDGSMRLPYAWVDGANRGHAVAKMEAGSFPIRILEEIERFAVNDTSVRVS